MSPHLSVLVLMCLSVVQLYAEEAKIVKHKTNLLGDWSSKSSELKSVTAEADHAVRLFNTKYHSGKKAFKLVTITSAKVQVTNTINYKIVMVLGKTRCLKSENHALKTCELEKKRLTCIYRVEINPRTDERQEQRLSCIKFIPDPPTPAPTPTPTPTD
ncbi:uncharacterized protein LOC143011148 [Genypterus blacodes]|uniref:uncharacterized protein LOC143011148 n=1 Tax=Genypterus blacodes TaxID=154954 RepID=UPI003F770DD8